MGVSMSLYAAEPDELDAAIRAVATEPAPTRSGIFGLFRRGRSKPPVSHLEDFIHAGIEGHDEWTDDLDKAWDVIMNALNQLHAAGKADQAVTEAVAGEHSGQGGPMGEFGWVSAPRVSAVSTALSAISAEAFAEAAKVVPDDVYLYDLLKEDGPEYFVENFERLKTFYDRAAAAGRAVVLTAC